MCCTKYNKARGLNDEIWCNSIHISCSGRANNAEDFEHLPKYGTPETGKYKVDELAGVDALLLGRTTYENFAGFWPTQTDAGFGIPINKMPKYVVSRSLQKVDWNNSHILRDVAGEVAALKKTDGGDILV